MHRATSFTVDKPHVRPLSAAVALALLTLAAAPSQAQEAQSASDPVKLEQVVVTANKRAQNLQDVPAAISVLNDATLDRANVRDLDDLPALSPALTVAYNTQPGNFSINMRGIGTYTLGIGVEADVAVIIDDIPLGMQAGAFKDLADVGRIEVLKGPQSTLFGKSAIAGALNITTRPISGPLRVKSNFLLTNDRERRVGVSASGAVSDTFRVRVAASKTNFDGVVHDLATGKNVNGSKGDNLSGKFEWQPADGLTLSVLPHYNRTEKFCCSTAYTSMTPGAFYRGISQLPASLLLKDVNIGPGNVDVRNDYPTGGKFHDAGAGVKLNYQFPEYSPLAGFSFDSISSYDKYHMDDYQDNDNTDADVLPYLKLPNGKPTGMHGGLFQHGTFDVASTTQEFRLASPDRGRFRYLVGLWYGKNELARQLVKEPVVSFFGTAFGSEAWNVNKAVYGQSTWDFLPNTGLITGLRYNREDTGYNFRRLQPPPGPLVQTEFYTRSDTNYSTTGKIGLEHRFNPDHMVYALFSTGHKGVAYDLTSSFDASTAAQPAVPPETAKNFEAGWKASFLNNRAMLNVDVYRTDFKHFQQSAGMFDPDGTFRTALHSLGALRAQGLEIDGSIKVTRNLLLNGSFAYNKATVVEFENGPCYNVLNDAGTASVPGPGCAVNPKYNNTRVQNLAGKPLPHAPKIKVNFGGQYDIPLAGAVDGFVSGTYRFQDRTNFSLSGDPRTQQGAYSITNLSVGVKEKKDRYKLSVFVNNLFDKRYANGLQSTLTTSTWATAPTNPVRVVATTEWNPPRDYTRYFGVRLDLGF